MKNAISFSLFLWYQSLQAMDQSTSISNNPLLLRLEIKSLETKAEVLEERTKKYKSNLKETNLILVNINKKNNRLSQINTDLQRQLESLSLQNQELLARVDLLHTALQENKRIFKEEYLLLQQERASDAAITDAYIARIVQQLCKSPQ